MTTEKKDKNEDLQLPLPSEDWDEFPDFDKMIRIAVSGDVRVTELELKIINTPAFQRLRGVRQLGTAVQVYPTALHTRFDHSLGTLAMVDRMITEIKDKNNKYTRANPAQSAINNKQRAIARLYALLHDIAHVPFGHTLEDEFGIFISHDQPENKRLEKLLDPESTIGQLILADEVYGKEIYERFIRLIFSTSKKEGDENPQYPEFLDKIPPLDPNDQFIYDLVSNTVCADLLDYIKRDSYFCNLRIDLEYRFLKFLYLGEYKDEKRVLVRLWKGKQRLPREDVLTDLVRLLEARYMIGERVYFHHAKIIAGTMVARAAQEAKLKLQLDEEKLGNYTDETLIEFLATKKEVGEVANRLAKAYKERRLYKRAHEYRDEYFTNLQLSDHTGEHGENIVDKLANPTERREVENQIADDIGVNHGDVLLYIPRKKMNKKVHEALVEWKGAVREFDKIDAPSIKDRLRSNEEAHKRLWRIYLLLNPEINTEKMKAVACHAFESILTDSKQEKREHIAAVLRYRMLEEKGNVPIPPIKLENLVKNAAKGYLVDNPGSYRGDGPSINIIVKGLCKEIEEGWGKSKGNK